MNLESIKNNLEGLYFGCTEKLPSVCNYVGTLPLIGSFMGFTRLSTVAVIELTDNYTEDDRNDPLKKTNVVAQTIISSTENMDRCSNIQQGVHELLPTDGSLVYFIVSEIYVRYFKASNSMLNYTYKIVDYTNKKFFEDSCCKWSPQNDFELNKIYEELDENMKKIMMNHFLKYDKTETFKSMPYIEPEFFADYLKQHYDFNDPHTTRININDLIKASQEENERYQPWLSEFVRLMSCKEYSHIKPQFQEHLEQLKELAERGREYKQNEFMKLTEDRYKYTYDVDREIEQTVICKAELAQHQAVIDCVDAVNRKINCLGSKRAF